MSLALNIARLGARLERERETTKKKETETQSKGERRRKRHEKYRNPLIACLCENGFFSVRCRFLFVIGRLDTLSPPVALQMFESALQAVCQYIYMYTE